MQWPQIIHAQVGHQALGCASAVVAIVDYLMARHLPALLNPRQRIDVPESERSGTTVAGHQRQEKGVRLLDATSFSQGAEDRS